MRCTFDYLFMASDALRSVRATRASVAAVATRGAARPFSHTIISDLSDVAAQRAAEREMESCNGNKHVYSSTFETKQIKPVYLVDAGGIFV